MRSTKSSKTLPHKWEFEALGTNWSIETPKELAPDVRRDVAVRIETYDKTYSRFREDSLAYQLRKSGEYMFPSDITPLLSLYKMLYEITKGRMTPLIGGLLEQAGYDKDYSLTPKAFTSIPPFESLGWDKKVTLKPTEPIVLDIGAAGKGHLVDIIAQMLEKNGVNNYTIDASGDIKHCGEPETIGLEHPLDPSKVIGTVKLQNQSFCASAINRRRWGELHHIFDPATKQPTNSLLATWVIADTTMVADALATALFFASSEKLLEEFDFSFVSIDMNGAIDASPDFDGKLFT